MQPQKLKEQPVRARLLAALPALSRASREEHVEPDLVARYAAGELTDTEAKALTEHLAVCSDGRCADLMSEEAAGLVSAQRELYEVARESPSRLDALPKSVRTFQCRDALWQVFEDMASDLGCSVDYLINEAMKEQLRARHYYSARAPQTDVPPPPSPAGSIKPRPMAAPPPSSSPRIAPLPKGVTPPLSSSPRMAPPPKGVTPPPSSSPRAAPPPKGVTPPPSSSPRAAPLSRGIAAPPPSSSPRTIPTPRPMAAPLSTRPPPRAPAPPPYETQPSPLPPKEAALPLGRPSPSTSSSISRPVMSSPLPPPPAISRSPAYGGPLSSSYGAPPASAPLRSAPTPQEESPPSLSQQTPAPPSVAPSQPPPASGPPSVPASEGASRGAGKVPRVSPLVVVTTLPMLIITCGSTRAVVGKDRFIIGRGKSASDFTIKDPNISRQHAMVEFVDGRFFIVDMGSTNGIEYEGQRVTRKPIHDGDRFRIGDHEFNFSYRG